MHTEIENQRADMSEWFRQWRSERAAGNAALQERIRQHLAAGGSVLETCFGKTRPWSLERNCFVAKYRTPEHIAEHLAGRAAGFGATHRFLETGHLRVGR